ncbi:MAG TPA: class I SAM-dependent methyltransferase [Candidatus Acidoferrum sp.]|nr:class I SAM-dependent methyltransferase [Candidatus Acidoferrum sp.]
MPPGADRNDSYWTVHRARLFNQAVQISSFPAQAIKALDPILIGCRSVLDVGAGVGALAVPLAKSVEAVTALEPSPAMMEELRANVTRNHLTNVTCIQAAWGTPDLASHDLVLVANVASIFTDLIGFLTGAEPLACRAVALIQNVGPGLEKFYFGELYPLLLGREYPPRHDYLKTVTLLHSLGIYANVQIIAYHFDQPFQDLEEAAEFWKAQMRLTDPEQVRRLLAFLRTRLQRVGTRLVAPMRRQSAVITWRVAPKDQA